MLTAYQSPRKYSAATAIAALLLVQIFPVVQAAETSPDPGARTWTVWHTACPVYESTSDDEAEPLTTLEKGDEIEGFKYFVNGDDVEWIAFRRDGKTLFAPFVYLTYIPEQNIADGNLPIGEARVDRWNALPLNYAPNDLETIPGSFCYNTFEHRLRREALDALIEMIQAAREENLQLRVVSSFRSGEWQRRNFLRQLEKRGWQQRVSAKPGHSEHQLGTTVDLSTPDPRHVLNKTFGETPEGQWLKENSEKFGFRITYTEENRDRTGYIPEPWHLRYMGKPKVTHNN